jgi:hypothetical protein
MRSMRVVAALLVAMSFYGTTSHGGEGVFTIRGGGDLDWQPSSGTFGPTTTSSPTSASGTLSDPNGSAAYSIAAGPGVVRGSLAGSFNSVGRFNPSIQADAASELTLVGPTGFVAIPVRLNLHVDSTFTVEQCPDSCNISIGVLGHGGISRFSMGAGFTENGLGLTADPIPGGYHLHGDVATPEFGLTPNLPTSVGISLQINVNNLNHGFPGASVFAVGPSTVSFAPSGPVLSGVPPEYTVSGPGVVDNVYSPPVPPATFYTLPPCRLIDTRNPAAANGLGGPALASSPGQRAFKLTNVCGIPPTATALSVNVTVTEPAAAGFVTLFPGTGIAPATSTLNFGVGQERANNAVVRLATDGTGVLRVLNGSPGTVHFVLDVNGYLQ